MKEEAKSNIPQSCDVVTNFFYEGILLPFDDNIDSSDGFCDIIVKFIPELSMCYHSKARVPILLTVECVKLFEIQEKEKLKEDIKSEKIDSGNIINVIKENIDNNIDNSNKIKKAKTTKDDEYFIYIPDESKSKLIEVFDCKFSDLIKFYRSKSNYKYYDTYSLKSFIFKSNDDLRQELLTLQLIKKMKLIFESNRINLKLFPYEILTTSSESGLIEFLPNTISIDQFKKKYSEKDLNTFYREAFGDDFYIAQRNFCESLAAYSLVCYLLEIRDRHNGNILIDIEGNLIHIDFGFILGIGPGGTNFEQAPFKLTEEYVNILDGIDSTMFNYFKSLLYIGFIEIRKHFETLWQIIEITYRGNNELPCFKDRDIDEIKQLFQSKFLFEEPELDLPNFVDPLIEKCYDNSRTNNYDKYQSLTNGISY
jgi:phosphatidylinositol 4-kinase